MRPLTDTVPKALLEVAGKPFADWQLRLLASQGFSTVVYCLGHLGEQVEEFAGDGSRFGLRIDYVHEGATLRGTAGALRLALDAGVLDDRFAVAFGDSFLPIDVEPVREALRASEARALMTVYRNDIDPDLNNVVFRDGRVELYCKGERTPAMHHIDFGLSMLERGLIEELVPPDEVFDLADVMETLSRRDELAGFEVHERYYEIGSPRGLRDLERLLTGPQGSEGRFADDE
jgi:NDP-sugar pyrophosphorylase family protein